MTSSPPLDGIENCPIHMKYLSFQRDRSESIGNEVVRGLRSFVALLIHSSIHSYLNSVSL